MHTFSTAGWVSYYCTPHGACCGMVGTVNVSNSTPTPANSHPIAARKREFTRGFVGRAQALPSSDSSSAERTRKPSCFAGSVRLWVSRRSTSLGYC